MTVPLRSSNTNLNDAVDRAVARWTRIRDTATDPEEVRRAEQALQALHGDTDGARQIQADIEELEASTQRLVRVIEKHGTVEVRARLNGSAPAQRR